MSAGSWLRAALMGGFHIACGGINVAIQIELQRNTRVCRVLRSTSFA